MEQPFLSIVTVCRNGAATIEATAKSITAQTFGDYEWIVIEGVSTDGTLAKLEPYRARIAHLISEPDHGIYDAMNKGLRLVSGRYVHFLNSDDRFVDNDVLAKVAQRLTNQIIPPKLAYGEVLFVDERHGFTERVRGGHGWWSFVCSCPPHHQGVFMETEAARRLGGFSLKYGWSGDIGLIAAFKREWPNDFLPLGLPIVEFALGGASAKVDWLLKRERDRALAVGRELGRFAGYANFLHGTTLWGRSLLRVFLDRMGWLQVWRRCKQCMRRQKYPTIKAR